MTDATVPAALFREVNPNHYHLIAEESVALDAAWRILQAFELKRNGTLGYYTDDSRQATLDYLRGGGEERPHAGIFAVETYPALDNPDQTSVLVSNRNAPDNQEYNATLRAIIETVGIAPPTTAAE